MLTLVVSQVCSKQDSIVNACVRQELMCLTFFDRWSCGLLSVWRVGRQSLPLRYEAQYTVTHARSPWKNCPFAWECYCIIVAACRSLTDPCCILVSFTPSGADAVTVTVQAVHVIATTAMPPKRPPWADEDDASPTANASESFAPAPTRHPSVAPFGVFLRAFWMG